MNYFGLFFSFLIPGMIIGALIAVGVCTDKFKNLKQHRISEHTTYAYPMMQKGGSFCRHRHTRCANVLHKGIRR